MKSGNSKFSKRILRLFLITVIVFLCLGTVFALLIYIPDPAVNKNISTADFSRIQRNDGGFTVGNCYLKKNQDGIFELYIEGDDYERGLIYGVLAKELIEKQEAFFVNQVNSLVPNSIYRGFLKLMVAWFNKDIHQYIPDDNLREIYGVSKSFSDKFDYVGPKYYRILNYHAAHDIGHALNDYNLVGCTSFAVNKNLSEDSSLLIARNFDFYLGDGFAEDKLLMFVNPSKGYKYASYSWAGFTGVVSGMNEKGLTVTINASKSDVPYKSKTPISILARKILQHAKNINEAAAIAEKTETFVSESLLIASAEDDKAILIEKSPRKMDFFQPEANYLICSNHYQGKVFMQDSANLQNIDDSDSKARYERLKELLAPQTPLDFREAAEILRNKQGANGKEIGYGNPKALNQLLAHHAVIFKPEERLMWVSTSPYQLGSFVCYDLKKALAGSEDNKVDSLKIEPDSFLLSEDYKRYEAFKITRHQIFNYVMLDMPLELNEREVKTFIANNPKSYITYMDVGDYYKKRKEYLKAIKYYQQSLHQEVASKQEVDKINQRIESCKKKLEG